MCYMLTIYQNLHFRSLIVVRVAQWLERRLKDLMILASPVRIPLWDVGAGPSDETVKTEVPCRSRCGTKKNPTAKSHEC
jgi:hypothetical protein